MLVIYVYVYGWTVWFVQKFIHNWLRVEWRKSDVLDSEFEISFIENMFLVLLAIAVTAVLLCCWPVCLSVCASVMLWSLCLWVFRCIPSASVPFPSVETETRLVPKSRWLDSSIRFSVLWTIERETGDQRRLYLALHLLLRRPQKTLHFPVAWSLCRRDFPPLLSCRWSVGRWGREVGVNDSAFSPSWDNLS